ncbi:hypothetical protein WH96_03935 [Kiloniella spongiae]|uniref:Uncharacterized protein n=1 Tax=Kiloniella spongiae TaxID=1489064 RepID=A0A0H2MH87_9PROT|nr:hypothetical protein [Kiloniella spongiae]KLN61536.1 hypothetical protein WH96_03935 [Kiloniella spongiae]
MIRSSLILPSVLNNAEKADETKALDAINIFKKKQPKSTELSDREVVDIFRKSSNIKELNERLKHHK